MVCSVSGRRKQWRTLLIALAVSVSCTALACDSQRQHRECWLCGAGNFGQSIDIYEPDNLIIVSHGLQPVASSREYSAYRTAFDEAVREALSPGSAGA